MCIKSEVEEILLNLQQMTIMMRPSCWHQNFGPNGLSAPAKVLCLNFFSSVTADFNISSAFRWAIQDQWSSGCLFSCTFYTFKLLPQFKTGISQPVFRETFSPKLPLGWALWTAPSGISTTPKKYFIDRQTFLFLIQSVIRGSKYGPCQENLVLIAYASSEGSGMHAVSPELPLLAHTSSESRGTFRQKARSLAPLNGWAYAVKICHNGMLEDTISLDGAHMFLRLGKS